MTVNLRGQDTVSLILVLGWYHYRILEKYHVALSLTTIQCSRQITLEKDGFMQVEIPLKNT